MNTLNKMKEEVERLEKLAFNNPTDEEVAVQEAQNIEERPVNEESTEEVITTIEEGASVLPGEKKERNNWKKEAETWKLRFTNYKNSTDAKLYALRTELTHLKEENLALSTKLDVFKSSVQKEDVDESSFLKAVISEEEAELLGEDAINSIQKLTMAAVKRAVDPLKKELEDAKHEVKQAKEREVSNEVAKTALEFRKRLGKLVSDYEDINVDPKFAEWLEDADPYSGKQRYTLLKKAERDGDVKRVADFFISFKEEISPGSTSLSLEDNILPVNSTASTSSGQETTKYIGRDFINKFYLDVAKGIYRKNPKKQREIEQIINEAAKTNRIR